MFLKFSKKRSKNHLEYNGFAIFYLQSGAHLVSRCSMCYFLCFLFVDWAPKELREISESASGVDKAVETPQSIDCMIYSFI